MKIRLAHIAHARSGDKADRADISLLAWDEAGYALLERHVTAERVSEHVAHLLAQPGVQAIERYPMPNLLAIKLVLNQALNGGAASSLRSDNLGKTLAALMLRMQIDIDQSALPPLAPVGPR